MPAARNVDGHESRLFFGIWPPAAAAASLRRFAESLEPETGGRPIPVENLHLTLAFLGQVASDRVAAAADAARAVAGHPFRLVIDRAGFWPRSRILWAGPAARPAALEDLAAALGGALRDAGFILEERAFAAHVTLIRNARRPRPRPPPELDWEVSEFVLVQSRTSARGSRYEPLERFALDGR